jgi:phage-related protein
MNQLWAFIHRQSWEEIGNFEAKEIKAWHGTNPLLEEARTCARMEAYVRNSEIATDRRFNEIKSQVDLIERLITDKDLRVKLLNILGININDI